MSVDQGTGPVRRPRSVGGPRSLCPLAGALLLAVCLFGASPARSEGPYLVRDINTVAGAEAGYTTETGGDGTADGSDAFPNDPAASVDTDGDGMPDDWNPGMTAADSTSGLVEDLDDDNDTYPDADELSAGSNPLDAGDTPPDHAPMSLALRDGYKVLASDGALEDRFGTVAVSGSVALVGAVGVGADAGAVYAFERRYDGVWVETQKLTASDGSSGDAFGSVVSLDGDRAVVGAYGDDPRGLDSGSAYVFERGADGTWSEVAKLVPPDGAELDNFGSAVAISGESVLVGAWATGSLNAGGAYLFDRRPDGSWAFTQKLMASDGEGGDHFGRWLALQGDRAVIGAWGDDDFGAYSGSAYVFERQGYGMWSEAQKLTAPDGAAYDWFGAGVAVSGDLTLVSARADDELGVDSGSVYAFARQPDGTWAFEHKLTAPGGAAGDKFGGSLALGGDTAAIGALAGLRGADSGAAYLFRRGTDGTWVHLRTLLAPDGDAGDVFGSVALSGSRVAVGATSDEDNGFLSGSAYFFTFVPSVPENAPAGTPVGLLEAQDPDLGESFTFELLDDAGGRFEIGAGNVLRVADASALDFETAANHVVTVRVSDSGGLFLDESLTIGVEDGNDPPVLAPVGDLQVLEGAELSALLSASDPNGDEVAYAALGSPAGAALDPGTGAFSWTPGIGEAGAYTLAFTATDAGAPPLSDSSLVTITVLGDADQDGVADAVDAFAADPAASVDTDADGLPDAWNAGATPEQIAASGLTVDLDDDNDGIPDVWELLYSLDPLSPTDAAADPDGDGLTNLEEYHRGTSPWVSQAAGLPSVFRLLLP